MFKHGANELTIEELEELFNDDVQQETPPADEETEPQSDVQTENDNSDVESNKDDSNNIEQTKAFARRLKASTDKARAEEREAIAKSFGFDSYDAMVKSKEAELIKDKGYDPEEISPMLEELVKQRINADPRMEELANLRKKSIADYGKKELAEISKLTNGQITRFDQLPRAVIDLWKQKGSLKSAYIELEGENLITKLRNEQSKGSTSHMNTPNSNTQTPSNTRLLNAEEKRMWKLFNPNISDEELNKKTTNK